MSDSDHERIAKKAHELWEAEGHPHGRDMDHWVQAKEIVALHDSAGDALLPRDTGATTPVEEMSIAVGNEGEAPGLTDTGTHDLTSTSREPSFKPAPAAPVKKAAAKRVAAPKDLAKTEDVAPKRKPASRAKAK
jgi:hypothetical protein